MLARLAAPALLAGVLTALPGALLLGTAAPAVAACDAGPLGDDLDAAQLVVTGTVTSVEAKGERQVYTLAVRRVYKGESDQTLKVTAPAASSDCALDVAQGEKWLFVSRSARAPQVRLDYGSRSLTAPVATQVADRLGSGEAPKPPAADTDVTLTTVGSEAPGYWQIALPGAVLAVGGALVLVLARALGSPRHPHKG